jgi:hypothetical protein
MNKQYISLEHANLTRIGYLDVLVPPEVVGLAEDQVSAVPWAAPLWAEGSRVRVGTAAWFADIAGERLVFDPLQAADAVLRADRAAEERHQSAVARVFESAGFARESVDLVVMTHIDGVGMLAWRDADGGWTPFFPNARILISERALDDFRAARASSADDIERGAWQALLDAGLVDTFADGEWIMPGLRAAVPGGHCPGHAVLHFGGAGEPPELTMLGHLAVSPLHLATGECPALHTDPAKAWSLLHGVADDERLLVGPLWPSPGYGRWVSGVMEPGAADG